MVEDRKARSGMGLAEGENWVLTVSVCGVAGSREAAVRRQERQRADRLLRQAALDAKRTKRRIS